MLPAKVAERAANYTNSLKKLENNLVMKRTPYGGGGGDTGGGKGNRGTCHHCGQYGHIAKGCPLKAQGETPVAPKAKARAKFQVKLESGGDGH